MCLSVTDDVALHHKMLSACVYMSTYLFQCSLADILLLLLLAYAVILQEPATLFVETGIFTHTWHSPIRLGYPASEPGSLCLSLVDTGISP